MIITMLMSALLTVTIPQSVCFAPCEIRVKLQVEPEKDNQKVTMELISENFYRFSELPLTEKSPKTTMISYPATPSGEYTLRVLVYKHDGGTWVAAQEEKSFRIIGAELEGGR